MARRRRVTFRTNRGRVSFLAPKKSDKMRIENKDTDANWIPTRFRSLNVIVPFLKKAECDVKIIKRTKKLLKLKIKHNGRWETTFYRVKEVWVK